MCGCEEIKVEQTELKTVQYLRNIKSEYILKHIFSYINQKEKLNLIIYKKELQEKIGVNIEDYKKVSGKCRIIEKNGKGREYKLNTNELIFEGEYLNGKRNGKGKEYDDEVNLIFEGEYLNGNKWNGNGYDNKNNIAYTLKNGNGLIKEYYYNGELIFEGEYLNGKRNGKGKEYKYNYFGDKYLIFEGEYLNGERNGKGKEYDYKGELIYEGEYLNGKKVK